MARPEISSTLLRIAGKTDKRNFDEFSWKIKIIKFRERGREATGPCHKKNIKKRKIGKSITKSFVPQ